MYTIRKDTSLGYPEITYPEGFAGGSMMALKYQPTLGYSQKDF
jgi:hypothetical protein